MAELPAVPRRKPPSDNPWYIGEPETVPPEQGGLFSALQELLFGTSEDKIRTEYTHVPSRMAYNPSNEYLDYAMHELGYGEWNPHSEYLMGDESLNAAKNIDMEGMTYDESLDALLDAARETPMSELRPVWQDALRRDYLLSAGNAPIAELGFDPSRMAVHETSDIYSLYGAYNPLEDRLGIMSVMAARRPTMMHEFTHRGLERLRKHGVKGIPTTKWSVDEDEAFTRAYIQRNTPAPYYKQTRMRAGPTKDLFLWYTETPEGIAEMNELVKRLDKAASGILGEEYDAWAGDMP